VQDGGVRNDTIAAFLLYNCCNSANFSTMSLLAPTMMRIYHAAAAAAAARAIRKIQFRIAQQQQQQEQRKQRL